MDSTFFARALSSETASNAVYFSSRQEHQSVHTQLSQQTSTSKGQRSNNMLITTPKGPEHAVTSDKFLLNTVNKRAGESQSVVTELRTG
jgi:hypothetical protein